jgi:cytochrome c oxidase subunit 2
MNITWILILLYKHNTSALHHLLLNIEVNKVRKHCTLLITTSWRRFEFNSSCRSIAGLILQDCMLDNIMFVDEDEDTVVIELYAQQFNWKARYSGMIMS